MGKRFCVASDLHGDRQNPTAVKLFHKFVAAENPAVRVFAGDLWDARALRIKASKDEKHHSMLDDFRAGMEFLERYEPTVVLLGNHDQRLWDAMERDGLRKTGLIPDLAHTLTKEFETWAAKNKVLVLPYHRRRGVYQIGSLRVVHGFSYGNQALMLHARAYGSVVMGHIHTLERYSAVGMKQAAAWSAGCLCDLDMDFNRGNMSAFRQENGWAYGEAGPGKRFSVLQAAVVGNTASYAKSFQYLTA